MSFVKSLTLFFLVWMPFISFYCPTVLTRNSSTMLKKCGERGHTFLSVGLGGNHSVFYH